MRKHLFVNILALLQCTALLAQVPGRHNLSFTQLAKRWDEAMPLGNGLLGVLVWEKGGNMRLSLDRADLWDERKAFDLNKLNFRKVEDKVKQNQYADIQQVGDAPYDEIPYPTKLPAAALELDTKAWGNVVSSTLDINTALNTIHFTSGVVFTTYVHATRPYGRFLIAHLPGNHQGNVIPRLVMHRYATDGKQPVSDNTHAGEGLSSLGYQQGQVTTTDSTSLYHQPTNDGRFYEVLVKWKRIGEDTLAGCWTISNNTTVMQDISAADKGDDWTTHIAWWKQFWAQSAIALPDSVLERQYYLEQYKLGCVARTGAPAITLQAIWTADNGSLPPWKGDFHNDLNTQLSYWPAYTANHLTQAATYTDWLWKIKPNNEKFTRQYFEVNGLNVPGVVTLSGDPMGGWIQYSLSPTLGAWCAQHFYWQWRYSMDSAFLKSRAYPYIKGVAQYLEAVTRLQHGQRKLPLSSSPEYRDNARDAWFTDWTNFDLSLTRFLFTAAADVSESMGKPAEAKHWREILQQVPQLATTAKGLSIAPGLEQVASHRHMSPYMAIYPLGLLDENKAADKWIIDSTLQHLASLGTREWCGYSFSWMACLYARAYQADSAVKQLQIFATHFCSPNSFHLNGDQQGGVYSGYTYRPFTLEGNFAFAQGVQELLLQSRRGYLQVFPAVPSGWKNVSFTRLRGEGAFLVSASKTDGVTRSVTVAAEQNGTLRIRLPFEHWRIRQLAGERVKKEGPGIGSVYLHKGETVVFESAEN
ncbi:glycosyl hydrolase family 95 catalytic domain-containing protein [Deminuibacter soli]|uniref:Uncharacterized protein n=1 Tax=Deminuibacter soli TaxID=2291815 RepID=A0A3E1NGC9_9BACT|nr:glycoside hydrolase N-terminal domain-containing protein [Deminuibacter soli]RFM26891.1 hypothetical protein DXN05_18050 [Deminuibacter soli]